MNQCVHEGGREGGEGGRGGREGREGREGMNTFTLKVRD